MTAGQLTLDLALPVAPDPVPEARTYWENCGPNRWEPVTVRTRYRLPAPGPDLFPHLTTGATAPRNVLVERADGTADVRPVRLLRTKQPRCRPDRPRLRDLRGQRINRKHRIVDVPVVGDWL